MRPGIQPEERPAQESEFDGEHVAGLSRRIVGRRAIYFIYATVGQKRYVELGGLLGIAVEPEARGYRGHKTSPCRAKKIRILGAVQKRRMTSMDFDTSIE